MSSHFLKATVAGARLGKRCVSTSILRSQNVVLDQTQRDRIYPKIGNRDVVGFGINGTAMYDDMVEFPCPAIRFGANTPEVMALREKEKGDWNKLSIEDKKALYRASFCQTFAEIHAPTSEWKVLLVGVLLGLSATAWIVMWMKKYVYGPVPHTITKEWQLASAKRMVEQEQCPVEGFASTFDYEKGEFKK